MPIGVVYYEHFSIYQSSLCFEQFLSPDCISFSFVAVKSHPFGSDFDSSYVSEIFL